MATSTQSNEWQTIQSEVEEPFRAEEESVQGALNRLFEERSGLQSKETALMEDRARIYTAIDGSGLNLISGIFYIISGILGIAGVASLLQMVNWPKTFGGDAGESLTLEALALTATVCSPALLFWRRLGLTSHEKLERPLIWGISSVVLLAIGAAILLKRDAALILSSIVLGSASAVLLLIGGFIVEKCCAVTIKVLHILLVRKRVIWIRSEIEHLEKQRYGIPRRRAEALANARDRQIGRERERDQLERWKSFLESKGINVEVKV